MIAYRAMKFALEVHAGQVRKYTGNPYSDHLAEVAGIVASVAGGYDNTQAMIATAWLHDCVEDQNVSPSLLFDVFGLEVQTGVLALSDMETGNRAWRKQQSCFRLAAAPEWVQTIKVADIISNTASIMTHDPDFAVVYLKEKKAVLDAMKLADVRLVQLARAQVGAFQ